MTNETFTKVSKVVDKPSNVKIDICLCTSVSLVNPGHNHVCSYIAHLLFIIQYIVPIHSGSALLLVIQMFIFMREASLLSMLCRSWLLAEHALQVLHSVARELRAIKVRVASIRINMEMIILPMQDLYHFLKISVSIYLKLPYNFLIRINLV